MEKLAPKPRPEKKSSGPGNVPSLSRIEPLQETTNLPKVKEEKLIQKCQRGDRKAQRILFERFQADMFRVCYRYVRGQAEAEDLLCQGFLKVFEHLGDFRYRGPGSLAGWIRRIMVNESLMHLRKQKFEFVSEDHALELAAPERTDQHLDAEELYALVRALPLGYRTVFNLFALEGYTHAEIAAQMGISEGTSRSQLAKARRMLQEMMAQKGMNHATGYRQTI